MEFLKENLTEFLKESPHLCEKQKLSEAHLLKKLLEKSLEAKQYLRNIWKKFWRNSKESTLEKYSDNIPEGIPWVVKEIHVQSSATILERIQKKPIF